MLSKMFYSGMLKINHLELTGSHNSQK